MNPAVLVIDMQEKFLKEHCEEARSLIVASQLEMLSYCAKTDVPVIVVEYKECGSTIDVLLEKIKSVPRVKKVTKCKDNAFHHKSEPNLRELLDDKWILDYLVFMGVNADCCVKRTAIGALNLGYRICTSADLIADEKIHLEREKKENIYSLFDSILLYFGFKRNTEEYRKEHDFLMQEAVEFYKQKSNFFNNHKDLIAHLEVVRKTVEVLK